MGCVGSCLGSCAAQCACSCLDKACGGCRSKSGSLLPYMGLFLVSTALALVLRFWGQPLLVNLYVWHLDLCDTERCLGIGGVNRITFALFVFFFFHFILLKFAPPCSRLDSQSWWMKLLLFVIVLVLAWIIPNEPWYMVWMHIARVVSAFFLLLQLLILIDFGYNWNESWTSEERSPAWRKAVLGISILIYLASFTFFILDIFFFTKAPDGAGCHTEKTFIALTFVFTFLTTVLSISSYIEKGGGLLPAGVVTIYSYWLLFSALTSDPSVCNTVSSRSRELAPMILGLCLTTLSVTYASYSVATNSDVFDGAGEKLNGDKISSSTSVDISSGPKSYDSEPKTSDVESGSNDDVEDDEPTDSSASVEKARLSARFHGLMCMASCYVCMLLSGWGSQATAEDPNASYDLNFANMYVKMASQWACLLLYTWTLIAPKVCAGRDFSN